MTTKQQMETERMNLAAFRGIVEEWSTIERREDAGGCAVMIRMEFQGEVAAGKQVMDRGQFEVWGLPQSPWECLEDLVKEEMARFLAEQFQVKFERR